MLPHQPPSTSLLGLAARGEPMLRSKALFTLLEIQFMRNRLSTSRLISATLSLAPKGNIRRGGDPKDRHRWSTVRMVLGVMLLAAELSATPPVPKPSVWSPSTAREILTASQLLGGIELARPQNDRAFARPAGAAAAAHRFEGRLVLTGQARRSQYRAIRGVTSAAQRRLPAFDHAFVQRGSHLIPTQRGVITGDATWNVILGTGRVWQEPTDRGFSRASLPFALMTVNQMCTHNGVLTFLFDATSVSSVWYQITQETCLFRHGDFWGMLDARYHPGPVTGAANLRQAHAREVTEQGPRAPLGQLAIDAPGFDLGALGSGVTRQHITSYGVVYGGVSYLAPCRTRFGNYAYCHQMRTPSYSVAKSAFAGVALMRLAQKYGASVLNEKIAAWVVEAATSPGDWSDVTFENALGMATGHYHRSESFSDENNRLGPFFSARTRAQKLAAAFDAPRRAAPGSTWVYRSSDHFILTRAMESFLRDREGPNADLFELLVRDVYTPLGMGPGFHSILRTADGGWRGTPFGFSGLFFTADDIGKLATFLQTDRGRIGRRQVLHRPTLDAAMQRVPDRRGLPVGAPATFYQHGFWGARFLPPGESAERAFWVPYMAGFGGIMIAMLPNGATYHYASDNNELVFARAAIEAMARLPLITPEDGSGDGDGGGDPTDCPLPAGHPHYCRDCGPCGDSEGDCDRDTDCLPGLSCTDNIGASFGFHPGIDVCTATGDDGGTCPLPAGHPRYCADCGPCRTGEGDCDSDAECIEGIFCVDNIGAEFGFHPGIDVCR